ncbi:MAG: homocysteine S-methyltransferase family protein, partial [Butyricicoccus sp.]|nr:homocysteine S-methyltransferase family protein [Butyricicoccus sp.]
MGTMLQAAGLKMGVAPESMNLTAPEVVIDIHRQYIAAGSDIVYTNTFGANRHKLARTEYSVAEIVRAGVACARKAVDGTNAKVALDIGPIGQLIEPYGTMKFEEAYDVFREMIEAGADVGADWIAIETMTDLYEVKAAVL